VKVPAPLVLPLLPPLGGGLLSLERVLLPRSLPLLLSLLRLLRCQLPLLPLLLLLLLLPRLSPPP
jgi:hypothetical protein